MASLHLLHYSTLQRILFIAVGPRVKKLGQWKHKLQLLHVCKLWRSIAKPAVFREIIAYADVIPEKTRFFIMRKQKLVFYSNIAVFVVSKAQNYADSLYIGGAHPRLYPYSLVNLFNILNRLQFDWPQVRTLVYDFCDELVKLEDYLHKSLGYIEKYYDSVGLSLSNKFPNIRQLVSNTEYDFPYRIVGAELYFSKLTTLISSMVFRLTRHYPFNHNLTVLYLNFGSGHYAEYMPFVDPMPLKFLVLKAIDVSTFLTMFSDNRDLRRICFPHLKLLGLQFSSYQKFYGENADAILKAINSNGPPALALSFPAIKYLLLSDCDSDYFIRQLAPWCKDMELIYIKGLLEDTVRAKELALKNTKRFILEVPGINLINNNDIGDIIDNIISSANSDIVLYFSGFGYYFSDFKMFDNIAWLNLTQLSLEGMFHFDTVFYFMLKLPNLQVFWVYELLMREDKGFKHIDKLDIRRLATLTADMLLISNTHSLLDFSRLKHLHLPLSIDSLKVHVGMLGFISQLIPSLETFNITKELYNAISQNMHIYKRACPRLQNITLGVFDKNLPKRNISLLKIDDDGFMGIPDF